jgi:hypothetical protein
MSRVALPPLRLLWLPLLPLPLRALLVLACS